MRAPVVARLGETLRTLREAGSSRCNSWKELIHIRRASTLVDVGAQ
jgi:hypothetical protein